MRPSVAVSVTMLAICICSLAVEPSSAARTCDAKCAGPIAPGQYRFHWGIKWSPAFQSPSNLQATFNKFSGLLRKWQDTAACQAAFVRSTWGSNATFFGADSALVTNLDVGIVMDFRSYAVIKPCLKELETTGVLTEMAPMIRHSARSILRLSLGKTHTAASTACAANTNAPAKLRYMLWCAYKADTSRSLAVAEDFEELVQSAVRPFPVRAQGGNDVIVDTATYPAAENTKNYEYTMFGDFIDIASLRTWVTNRDRFQLLNPGNPRRVMASCARLAMQIPNSW